MIGLAMTFLSSFSNIMMVSKPSELIPMMEFFLEKAKMFEGEENMAAAAIIGKHLGPVLEPSAEELNEFIKQAQKDPKVKPRDILTRILEMAKVNLANDPSLDRPEMTPKDIADVEKVVSVISEGIEEIKEHIKNRSSMPKNRNGESVN